MKLGTLLLRNAAISLSQLETALRSQVLYGGRLGTNLVELGFLDGDRLAAALGELYGLPVATAALLDAALPETLALIDARTAESLGAIPLGRLASFPDALAVAMIDPRDEAAIEELARATGHAIAPHVVSESRALDQLQRLYALPRKPRYVRAGTRRVLTDAVERRRALASTATARPRVEPPRTRSGPIAIAPAPPPPPALGFGDASERLADATHRDQIGAALVDYAVGRAAALVAFLVRDGNATGWRGYTQQPPPTPIADLGLPLGPTSVLRAAAEAGEPFRGAPPDPAHPVEGRLWTALGLAPAGELIVVPIMVRHRPVNLVYVHPLPGVGFTDQAARELFSLCSRAADAYVRLIQRAKSA
jgi:hypothetical protein